MVSAVATAALAQVSGVPGGGVIPGNLPVSLTIPAAPPVPGIPGKPLPGSGGADGAIANQPSVPEQMVAESALMTAVAPSAGEARNRPSPTDALPIQSLSALSRTAPSSMNSEQMSTMLTAAMPWR